MGLLLLILLLLLLLLLLLRLWLLLLLAVVAGCCWLLLLVAVVGCCCWLLLLVVVVVVGCCCWLLLVVVVVGCCCWLLLLVAVVGCCCWLLSLVVVVGCCCWLLLLACCWLSLFALPLLRAALLRCSVDVAGWLAAAVPTSARVSPTIQSRCAIDAPNRRPHSRLMRRRRSDAPPAPTLGPTPASWSTQRGASPASSSTRRCPRRRPAHVSCRKLCATGRRLASSVGPGQCMPGSRKKRAWQCCPARVHLDPGTAPSPPRLCFQLRTAGAAAGRRGGLPLPPQPPQVSWQPRLLEAGTRSVNTELVVLVVLVV